MGRRRGGRHAEAVRETVDILIKVLTAFLCGFSSIVFPSGRVTGKLASRSRPELSDIRPT